MKAVLKDGIVFVDGKEVVVPSGVEFWLKHQPEGTEAFVKEEDVHFGKMVWNAFIYTKTGNIRLVLNKYGVPTPIVRRNEKGFISERTTAQLYNPEKGDIVIGIDWGHGQDGKTVFEYRKDGSKVPYDFGIYIGVLSSELSNWLTPKYGRQSAFLDDYITRLTLIV